MKENERLNVIIVVGVLLVIFSLVGATAFTSVPQEIKEKYTDLIMVVISGLIGFLSRGFTRQSVSSQIEEEEGNKNEQRT